MSGTSRRFTTAGGRHRNAIPLRTFPGQWELALLQDRALSSGGIFGRIAQLVEQLTLNQRVPGSSPGAPTNRFNHLATDRELHFDTRSVAHFDKFPLFVLASNRFRAPARRC
jgi:hypothetical protein